MTAPEAAKAVNDAFGNATLLRTPRRWLATCALPPAAKEFLRTGGFPPGRIFAFNFAVVGALPTIRAYAPPRGYSRDDLANAVCLADSWGGVVIVANPPAWNVLWIDLSGEHQDMFVNSNVESLGASLAAYASLAPLRRTLEPAKLSSYFQHALLQIDAPCVEGWWSTVIQEIEFGLS